MSDDLARRVMERVRRKHFKLPDPDRVTEWAYEVCCENLITAQQLYEALLRNGADYPEAYAAIFGEPDYKQFGDDWRGYVRQKRTEGKSLEYIAMLVQCWWGRSCPSEIRRICDESARAKQREYAAHYRERHRETIRERDRQYYTANRDRILAARKARRANTRTSRG